MKTLLSTALAVMIAAVAVSCCGQKQQEEKKEMIRLNVTVTVNPDYLAKVVEGLNELAAESRREEGCIGYEIYQSTRNPNELIIMETWANQEVLDAHGQTPHYTTILPPLGDKMSLNLERFEF